MCDAFVIDGSRPEQASKTKTTKRSLPASCVTSPLEAPKRTQTSGMQNFNLNTTRSALKEKAKPRVQSTATLDMDEIHSLMRRKSDKSVLVKIDGRHQKFRRVLVDWLCEAGESFGFERLTVHCAVQYLDRVLSSVAIERNMLQLVALCCLIVSAKFEESDCNLPTMRKFRDIVFSHYELSLIIQMEKLVLEKLNWSLSIVTPLHFVEYYLVKGCLFTDDKMHNGKPVGRSMSRSYKKYCRFFADVILQEDQFQGHKPVILACSILSASRKALKVSPEWRPELSRLTNVSEAEFSPVLCALFSYYESTYPAAKVQDDDKENQERASPKGVGDIF